MRRIRRISLFSSMLAVTILGFVHPAFTFVQDERNETVSESKPAQAEGSNQPVVEKSTAGTVQVMRSKLRLVEDVKLAAAKSGIISAIDFKRGSRVTAKTVIAKLDDSAAVAKVKLAEIAVESDISRRYATKRMEITTLAYENALQAKKGFDKAFTEMEMRRLKLNAEEGKLSVEKAEQDQRIAEAQLAEATTQLKLFHLTSPINGIVSHIHKSVGESVREGEIVVEVVNPTKIRVEGYVTFNDSLLLRPGMKVVVPIPRIDQNGEVQLDANYEPVLGKLNFISPVIDPISREVQVSAVLDNRDGLLKAGMPADMTIYLDVSPAE